MVCAMLLLSKIGSAVKKGEKIMEIAKMIDHTMLKADATAETITRYCGEAREHGFASVCVNSCHVPLVSSLLKGSEVKTCCVDRKSVV